MAKAKKTRNALTYETLPALFTGICDAIRTKTGGTDPINHQDIPASIENLPAGGGIDPTTQTAVSNGGTGLSVTITAAKSGLMVIIGSYLNSNFPSVAPTSITVNGVAASYGAQNALGYAGANLSLSFMSVMVKVGDTVVVNHGGSNSIGHGVYYIEEET